MKHMIAELVLMVFMAFVAAASAQDDLLVNLVIEDRQITGTIEACFGEGTEYEQWETILVDCPLPAQAYTKEIITTTYRRIGKKDVQKALRAIGQRDQGQFISDETGFRFAGTERFDPSADITKEDAAEQAVRIGLDFFEALGVEVAAESAVISRPYDEEEFMRSVEEEYIHRFSDIGAMMDRQRAQWKRTHRYETRAAQYTRVHFHIMINGMRVASWPSYPAGFSDETNARIAFDTGVSVLVSDSGVLVEAQAGRIPQVKSRRMPREEDAAVLAALRGQSYIRAGSWQEAFKQAQQMGSLPRNSAEELWKMEDVDKPITRYASQTVVTEIYPCLYTISKDEWVMIWHIESRQQYADGCRF